MWGSDLEGLFAEIPQRIGFNAFPHLNSRADVFLQSLLHLVLQSIYDEKRDAHVFST